MKPTPCPQCGGDMLPIHERLHGVCSNCDWKRIEDKYNKYIITQGETNHKETQQKGSR